MSTNSIEAAIGSQWIRVASPQDTHFHRMLLLHVHPGEAQAIALAADLKADVVLIDEHEGRELASEAGLSVMGILGVLLKAKHNAFTTLTILRGTGSAACTATSPRRLALRICHKSQVKKK